VRSARRPGDMRPCCNQSRGAKPACFDGKIMETQKYADFSLSIHNRTVKQRIPVNGTIEVTQRCPLNCVHCYNNRPAYDRAVQQEELTYEEHCRILDEIAEAGCLWLLFTGGEIFLRKDFLDIYRYAKHKGLLVTLFTNGVLIDEKIADALAECPPFSIEITLYGRTRETHERITRVPGSYDRLLHGIKLLRDRGLPLKLKTMAITLNRHEIWEMKRFVEQELGLEFRFDATINSRIDGSHRPLNVRLAPKEIVRLDLQEPRRVQEWLKFHCRFGGTLHPPQGEVELYHCGGGVTGFAVNPAGVLRLCVLSPNSVFDLRQGRFEDGWAHALFETRYQKTARRTKCTSCSIKSMCGMCPANGALENHDAEAPVDFLCRLAHLRAYAFGIPIYPHGECNYCEGGPRYQELIESANSLREAVERNARSGSTNQGAKGGLAASALLQS
jgi:radical SAM protein with 4Fe4S-binding SPASM domain